MDKNKVKKALDLALVWMGMRVYDEDRHNEMVKSREFVQQVLKEINDEN